MRVLHHIEIQPSALTAATSSGSPFVANRLHPVSNVVLKPGGERTSSNTSRVCLHDTNSCLDGLWGHTKSSANTTDSCGAGGNVRVGSKISVKHGGIGTLGNYSLSWVSDIGVHVVNTIHNHAVFTAIELFVKLAQLVEFFLLVEFGDTELVFEDTNKSFVLGQESVPV